MLWMYTVFEGAEQIGPAGDDPSLPLSQEDGCLLERAHGRVIEGRQRHEPIFPSALRTVSGFTGMLSILTPIAL